MGQLLACGSPARFKARCGGQYHENPITHSTRLIGDPRFRLPNKPMGLETAGPGDGQNKGLRGLEKKAGPKAQSKPKA